MPGTPPTQPHTQIDFFIPLPYQSLVCFFSTIAATQKAERTFDPTELCFNASPAEIRGGSAALMRFPPTPWIKNEEPLLNYAKKCAKQTVQSNLTQTAAYHSKEENYGQPRSLQLSKSRNQSLINARKLLLILPCSSTQRILCSLIFCVCGEGGRELGESCKGVIQSSLAHHHLEMYFVQCARAHTHATHKKINTACVFLHQ